METLTNMERLVHLLNEVNNSDITPRDYLNETHHSAVPLIKSLLSMVLITEGGHLDWDAKDELHENGFEVVPVEQDRWGWLEGAVITDVGQITFG